MSGALFPPGSARRTKRAVWLTVAVIVAGVVVCGGGSVLVANLLGLVGCEPRDPYVSAVQNDARRVSSLFPALATAQPRPSGSASGSPSGSPAGSASAAPSDGASPSTGPSGIADAHYQFRDARPHTCPEIAPVYTIYEGFAVLTPERAEALRAGLQWTPAGAPTVPDDLQQFAPANAAWQRSDVLDTATRAKVWYDTASRTAFFNYLTD